MQRYLSFMLIVILVTFLINSTQANSCGLRSVVTQRGIDYARTVGEGIIIPKLQNVIIPDIHKSANLPVLGTYDIGLTGIHLRLLGIPTTTSNIDEGGMHIAVSGLNVFVYANWNYRQEQWPNTVDSGSLGMVAVIDMRIVARTSSDGQGHVQVHVGACDAHVHNLTIKFAGGTAWFWNLISGPLSEPIKSAITGQLCPAVNREIENAANQALRTTPTDSVIDQWLEIDYGLIDNPIHGNGFIATAHHGEFYRRGRHTEFPGNPNDFGPPTVPSDKMLSIYVSDWLVNTAFKVYFDAGVLVATVTADNVPSSLPFKLNTASFKLFAPNLYVKFPDMPMQLGLAGTSAPIMTSFGADGGKVDITWIVDISIQVVTPTAGIQTAFVISSTVHADGQTNFAPNGNSSKITGSLKFLNATVSIASSNIGDLDVIKLQELINAICEFGIIPIANKKLQPGFPLPLIDGISLYHAVTTTLNGYLRLDFDVNYPHIDSELGKQNDSGLQFMQIFFGSEYKEFKRIRG